MGKTTAIIGVIALLGLLAAGCAGIVRTNPEPTDQLTPLPTQTPWIIETTVEVTRIVEVVATPTPLPAASPIPTPASDLPGTRDLVIVPRPPDSAITGHATTRKHLFLDYTYSLGSLTASELAEYYSAAMGNYGWQLTRLETEDDRYSLTFEPTGGAPDPLDDVDYVRVIVKGDINEISIIVNTLREVADWEPFFRS